MELHPTFSIASIERGTVMEISVMHGPDDLVAVDFGKIGIPCLSSKIVLELTSVGDRIEIVVRGASVLLT